MDVVLCPWCSMAWEHSQASSTTIHCTCGRVFAPGELFTMPRTPQGPGVETYPTHAPTCNCSAHPDDALFWTWEGHAETCPAHITWKKEEHRHKEQPLPTASTSPDIADLVVEDLKARKQVGISRYGRALQAHNGRDAMRDAYEEALDLCNYLRQMIYERDGK